MRYLLAVLLILAFSPAAAKPIDWYFHQPWLQVVKQAAADRSWVPVLAGITDPIEINRRVNRMPYIPESVDHWLDPAAFYRAGGGDCEDFAIAKYFALRAAGIADRRLMILVGHVSEVPHAVLLFDGRVLDSRTDRVYPLAQHPTFSPVYGVNQTEMRAWTFGWPTGRLRSGDNEPTIHAAIVEQAFGP